MKAKVVRIDSAGLDQAYPEDRIVHLRFIGAHRHYPPTAFPEHELGTKMELDEELEVGITRRGKK